MQVLWTFLIGLIAGAVAKLLVPGKDPGGWFVTALLGIAGSFVAKNVGMALGYYNQNDKVGFVASVVGAVIILAVYHLVRKFFMRHEPPPQRPA